MMGKRKAQEEQGKAQEAQGAVHIARQVAEGGGDRAREVPACRVE